MTMSAIMSRDYPVIMGVCLLSAVVVLAGNLMESHIMRSLENVLTHLRAE